MKDLPSQATDPDGGFVEYHAYSFGSPAGVSTATGGTGGGEKVDISSDGVITIASTAAGNTAVFAANGNNNGVFASIVDPASTSGTIPKEIYVVATDASGAQSVLRASFYTSCAPTIT